MDAHSLISIVDRFEREKIDVWLDGGWGVDALLGRETREHDDLDLVAELRHTERVIELLGGLGYDVVPGAPPKSFVLVDRVGRQVDIHSVTFDVEGGGVYQMEGGREWVYPAEGFAGQGSVDGRAVRCLSPEVQVLVHAGYELTEKDYRELYLLDDRFGVKLPDDVTARIKELG
jgi:lincosamide nucleotidyltransferase A/C/D/E